MEIIKEFGISGFVHDDESVMKSQQWYINLEKVFNQLKEHGYCYVKVKTGDYKGSIAKFKPIVPIQGDHNLAFHGDRLYRRGISTGRKQFFHINRLILGRLSWKGRRNNPKFTLAHEHCEVLLGYEGEEIFEKFDPKLAAENMKIEVFDIDNKPLAEGDTVLYINARYGQATTLCHGVIKRFQAYPKLNLVSVFVANDETGVESECKYPHSQIFKK